jgi:DNA-binding GntR family transcriptional regulator
VRDIYAARRAIESAAIRGSALADDERLQAVEHAVTAAEGAVRRGDWSGVGTASLAFHQALADLAGSARLTGFFGTIAAQLRLAFAEMEDESAFQSQWIPRDRTIAEHVLSGRRDEAVAELEQYLNDSERMVIDVIRSTRRRGERGGRP